MSDATPYPYRERLEVAARHLEQAATGPDPVLSAALMVEHVLPFIEDEGTWRAENGDVLVVIDETMGRAIPVIAAAMGARFDGVRMAVGLASIVVLLRDNAPRFLAERLAYVCILLCELRIVLSERDLKARGNELLHEVLGQLPFLPPDGASIALN